MWKVYNVKGYLDQDFSATDGINSILSDNEVLLKLICDLLNQSFTSKELEIAYCLGLINQENLTMDKLSVQLSNRKFPIVLESIKDIREDDGVKN